MTWHDTTRLFGIYNTHTHTHILCLSVRFCCCFFHIFFRCMDSNIVNIPVFHLLVLSIFNHHHHEATNQVVAMIMMTMVIRTLKKWGFKVFFIFLLIKKTKYSCISVVHFGNTHTKTQWLRLVFRLSDIHTDQYLKHTHTHTFGLWMKILCVCVCMWMSVKVHHTDWMNVNGEKTNDQDLASPHW